MSETPQGTVVWLTGLPQSGKSTLALRLRDALKAPSVVLDSDQLRDDMTPGWGYSDADRDAFYESVARLAARIARQGLIVIVAATANRARYRARARELAPAFIEVYVTANEDECARRDGKGLYRDRPDNLPSAATYDVPTEPDFTATGGRDDAAIDAIATRCATAASR